MENRERSHLFNMIRPLTITLLLFVCFQAHNSFAQEIDSVCPDCVEDPDFYASFNGDSRVEDAWIRKHIIYPDNYDSEMGDGVLMTFIVEKNGSISNIIIEQPVHEELEKEVIRLIKSMPKWIPAKHNGKKVRQRLLYDIWFNTA